MEMDDFVHDLSARIDAILPQSQCTKCGYAGCRPYAEALARDVADLNQCPPGGDSGIRKLAALLHKAYKPLNPHFGTEQPLCTAQIDEALCIGYTLCIQACPVDAIIGGARHMHTVLTDQCTGCELCVAPCPVDCITMTKAEGEQSIWNSDRASLARQRHERHQLRRRFEQEQRMDKFSARPQSPTQQSKPKMRLIQAAIERAKIQRAHPAKASLAADATSQIYDGT